MIRESKWVFWSQFFLKPGSFSNRGRPMSSAFRRESHVLTLDPGGREGKGRRGEGRTLIVVVESGDNCKSLNWCQYKTWLQLKTLMILVFWDILEITKKTCKAQQMTHPGAPCTDDTSSSWNVHMQNITTVHSLQCILWSTLHTRKSPPKKKSNHG